MERLTINADPADEGPICPESCRRFGGNLSHVSVPSVKTRKNSSVDIARKADSLRDCSDRLQRTWLALALRRLAGWWIRQRRALAGSNGRVEALRSQSSSACIGVPGPGSVEALAVGHESGTPETPPSSAAGSEADAAWDAYDVWRSRVRDPRTLATDG